jgi:SAM-dependent methyltransferase
VIPLSLYLLSFILCFEGRSWYRRGIYLRLMGVALGGMVYAMGHPFDNIPLFVLVPLFCAGLFIGCMFCHGELARRKPHPAHLTSFYLMLSLGGVLGALLVAVVAPLGFRGSYELPLVLGACALLLVIVLWQDPEGVFGEGRLRPLWLGGLAMVAAVLMASLYRNAQEQGAYTKVMVRNFYGVLRVYERVDPKVHPLPGEEVASIDLRYRELLNGTISHGLQFLGPGLRREPTSYYGRDSGVGLALRVAERRPGLRVGVIGLGVGTLAAYGRASDRYTFYEINPLVVRIANQRFSYLKDSAASIEIVVGDARLALERENPRAFDVLAVDAFSGDSIPVHLLTREAFVHYFRHLKPDGILAVHISNRYLDLLPVVRAAAATLNKPALLINNADDDKKGISTATWVLLSGAPEVLADPDLEWAGQRLKPGERQVPWTDHYSSLLSVLD